MNINVNYGKNSGDETLRTMAFFLLEKTTTDQIVFKMHASLYCIYCPNISQVESINLAEHIRYSIEKADIFIQNLTVSIGTFSYEELNYSISETDLLYQSIYYILETRLNIAKKIGGNNVCSKSEIDPKTYGKMLLIDNDDMNLQVLKTSFENGKYTIYTTNDSYKALNIIEKEQPSIILTEIQLPKMDGFQIIDAVSKKSSLKHIPFIIMSYQKTPETVIRAFNRNVIYYFKKPFMLSELQAIVKKNLSN